MSEAHYQREVEWYETLLTQKSKKIVELQAEIERLKDAEARLQAALGRAASDLDEWGAYTKANSARAALEGK